MIAGRVAEIWRYAVKSMAGEQLDRCEVGPQGIPGDRGWALRDEAAGEIRGAKRIPTLLQCRARYLQEPAGRGPDAMQPCGSDVPPVEITLPDGERVRSDSPDVGARLSAALGKTVTLWPLQPPEDTQHYLRAPMDDANIEDELRTIFGRLPDEPLPDLSAVPPEVFTYAAPLGTYFDVFPLHLLTTAALREVTRLNPTTRADRRRFRPNLLIEPEAGATGLVENEWLGRKLRIGDVEVKIEMATMRCVMPTLAQDDLPKDPSILRTIVRSANQNLGVYANVLSPGSVKLGDTVEVI